ncbi:hypothetical protein MTO96_042581, partial [Rhipicephalus appendiculatus]
VTHRGNCVPEDTAPKLTRLQKVGGCLHPFEAKYFGQINPRKRRGKGPYCGIASRLLSLIKAI